MYSKYNKNLKKQFFFQSLNKNDIKYITLMLYILKKHLVNKNLLDNKINIFNILK